MQCGGVRKYTCQEYKDSFFYPLDLENCPPCSKNVFEKILGTNSRYKLIEVTNEWFKAERLAFENKSSAWHVVNNQVSFVLHFCQVKNLNVDPHLCYKKIQKANEESNPSDLLLVIMRIRSVVTTLVKLNPNCYRSHEFSSICEQEAVFLASQLTQASQDLASSNPAALPSIKKARRTLSSRPKGVEFLNFGFLRVFPRELTKSLAQTPLTIHG